MVEIIFDMTSEDMYDYLSLTTKGNNIYELRLSSTTYDTGLATMKLDRKQMKDLFNALGNILGAFKEEEK